MSDEERFQERASFSNKHHHIVLILIAIAVIVIGTLAIWVYTKEEVGESTISIENLRFVITEDGETIDREESTFNLNDMENRYVGVSWDIKGNTGVEEYDETVSEALIGFDYDFIKKVEDGEDVYVSGLRNFKYIYVNLDENNDYTTPYTFFTPFAGFLNVGTYTFTVIAQDENGVEVSKEIIFTLGEWT